MVEEPKIIKTPTKEARVGSTFDSVTFTVPKTKDLLQNLFTYQSSRPYLFHLIILSLATQILLYLLLPNSTCKSLFLVLFVSYRLSYNGLLGYILDRQSQEQFWFKFVEKYKLLDTSTSLGKFVKKELSLGMDSDYDFDSMPPAFNSWLLFRYFVDFILLNDFVSYILFSLSYFQTLIEWPILFQLLRLVVGLSLIAFNVIVKLDAHRVIEDYAWYWGDFFFLVNSNLTFDGVFELAPHPMYSIGYFGYYGISLLTGSLTVFYLSLMAHAFQFLFLIGVENPHIDKIYNPNKAEVKQGWFRFNLDLYLPSDLFKVVIVVYGVVWFALSNLNLSSFSLSVIQTLIWRTITTLGLGFLILKPQSKSKLFILHYIGLGMDPKDAFNNFKQIYQLFTTMTYLSFLLSCYYSTPSFTDPTSLLPTLGALLLLLHFYIICEVYQALGDELYFYVDFFLPQLFKLKYDGIYRYLNHPEITFGHAGFYGLALICQSYPVFILAIIGHLQYLVFYYYVEQPHMNKRYKGALRKDAGVTKTLKHAANQLRQEMCNRDLKLALRSIELTENLVESLNKSLKLGIKETSNTIEDVVNKSNLGIHKIIEETRAVIENTKGKLIKVQESIDFKDTDLDGTTATIQLTDSKPQYDIGESIIIQVNTTTKQGWVGLYRVGDNPDDYITSVSSQNRYHYLSTQTPTHTFKDNADGSFTISIKFDFEKLFFKQGSYEFRYHDNNLKHNCKAKSEPIKIQPLHRMDNGDFERESVSELLATYSARLIANNKLDQGLNNLNEDSLNNLKDLVQELFQVNLDLNSLKSIENITKLAKRICKVKETMSMFSPPVTPIKQPNFNGIDQADHIKLD